MECHFGRVTLAVDRRAGVTRKNMATTRDTLAASKLGLVSPKTLVRYAFEVLRSRCESAMSDPMRMARRIIRIEPGGCPHIDLDLLEETVFGSAGQIDQARESRLVVPRPHVDPPLAHATDQNRDSLPFTSRSDVKGHGAVQLSVPRHDHLC